MFKNPVYIAVVCRNTYVRKIVMKRSAFFAYVVFPALLFFPPTATVFPTAMGPGGVFQTEAIDTSRDPRGVGRKIIKYILHGAAYDAAHVVIPLLWGGGATTDYIPFLVIGMGAFQGNTNMTSILFSDCGVTNIEASAFEACTNLEAVILPDSIRTIGRRSFADCTSLTTVIIPDGARKINFLEDCFKNTKLSPRSQAALKARGWQGL